MRIFLSTSSPTNLVDPLFRVFFCYSPRPYCLLESNLSPIIIVLHFSTILMILTSMRKKSVFFLPFVRLLCHAFSLHIKCPTKSVFTHLSIILSRALLKKRTVIFSIVVVLYWFCFPLLLSFCLFHYFVFVDFCLLLFIHKYVYHLLFIYSRNECHPQK